MRDLPTHSALELEIARLKAENEHLRGLAIDRDRRVAVALRNIGEDAFDCIDAAVADADEADRRCAEFAERIEVIVCWMRLGDEAEKAAKALVDEVKSQS